MLDRLYCCGIMGDTEMTNNVSEDDRKLFAGGLPQETTEAELKEYFGQFGTVASVNIKMDAMTGRSRGFAFIVYEDVSSLDKVLKDEFHNFKNKKVAVKKAASKQGKIYVGKFNTPITEDEIKQHFSQYGNVVEVQRPVDRSKNNEPKNFCFVTFEKEETANTLLKKASENVHGQEVELKKVTLKQEGGMRGGRGGGMRGGMGRGQGGHGGWGGGYDAWGGYGGGWGDYGGWGGYGAGGWGGGQAQGGWGAYGPGGGGGGKMGMGGGYQRGGRGGRGGGRAAPY